MLEGVQLEKSETSSLCFTIDDISDELKNVIRARLSEICYGAAKASRTSVIYSYEKTLTAFLDKFDTKSADTQKGMIGELLTHVLFLHYEDEFRAASPFFNMEEDSIKKGFDLVLHHKGTSEIWFVEVKAGECGVETSINKLGGLLSLAKNGLKTALNSERHTLWQNAVNGASLVIQDSGLKSQIETLLESFNEKAVAGKSASQDYNAVLVAVCFSGGQAFATGAEFEGRHTTQKDMNEFRDLMSIALQKDTIQSVVDFLRSEVDDG
ncbi:Hachiman antiphage defense system protein HamA [Primorskyibacter sedentarius]|uniref:Hachiman antiphage defense system protein HamA n=1 Tax=Primorskyibacter sedentarius TaxID=745311 RepID=UPI0010475C64|nr:Hachiman antiphage defense system protein HamA [Primorskyibacter sedentarius]